MVENLTLSKMHVHSSGLNKEQMDRLAMELEGPLESGQRMFRLQVEYHLNGRRLTPECRIQFRHEGRFECTRCQRAVKKLFDGFCYPCLQSSAQADKCVLNPVGCHYLQGTCREPAWGDAFCYQPHYLYLAFTDKYKVGITRRQQVPIRWMDQGATAAVLLAKVGSRHQAGVLEHFLAQTYADKSHWMKMLKSGNQRPSVEEIERIRNEVLQILSSALAGSQSGALRVQTPALNPAACDITLLENAVITEIDFPLWNAVPEKITSLNLDKTPVLESSLFGIKGQYLFLENGVFNVRRHEGYVVNCEIQNGRGPDCGV